MHLVLAEVDQSSQRQISALEWSWPDVYFAMARASCALRNAQGQMYAPQWPEPDVRDNGCSPMCIRQRPLPGVRSTIARAECASCSQQRLLCFPQSES